MRALAVLLTLAIAGPAMAQPYLLIQGRQAQAAADADAARSRDIALTNQTTLLEAHLQADQAVSNLQAARGPPLLVPGARAADAPASVIDTARLISIPDDRLAQSNARVLAAAANRR